METLLPPEIIRYILELTDIEVLYEWSLAADCTWKSWLTPALLQQAALNSGCIELHYTDTIIRTKNGKTHSWCDLPAIVETDGYQAWYQHDKRHRDNDLPAVIKADGRVEYWQHNKRHRDNDLPAIIRADGTQEWFQHGNFVRHK